MSFEEIIQHLPKLTPLLLIVGLILGLYSFKHLNGVHRTLLVYFILMLMTDLTGRVLQVYLGMNLILFPIYSFVEMSFFIYFYKKYFLRSKNFIIALLGTTGGLFIVGEFFYYFILNDFNPRQFQPYSKVVDNFVVILIAMMFFYKKINKFEETKWDNFPLNIVIFVYFILNLIFLLPFNFLVNESSGLKFYFLSANTILTVIFYICLIYFILEDRNLKDLPSKSVR
ncbi:hypothetical protein [Flavobacterium sp.]|uniref:hypothetical protein n=1 Tax=Flavobacterium sp. TaxID=239 RepID=UPI004033CDB7